jgi:hypothetical protein
VDKASSSFWTYGFRSTDNDLRHASAALSRRLSAAARVVEAVVKGHARPAEIFDGLQQIIQYLAHLV